MKNNDIIDYYINENDFIEIIYQKYINCIVTFKEKYNLYIINLFNHANNNNKLYLNSILSEFNKNNEILINIKFTHIIKIYTSDNKYRYGLIVGLNNYDINITSNFFEDKISNIKIDHEIILQDDIVDNKKLIYKIY